ncbi:MAG: thymidine kinase [Bacteroidales bacterium]|jgi:thymidine kinase|nr:thymidine kinase [Bacteroidales bacterium]
MFLENKANRNINRGWIEVVCGSMFSGKTEELLRRIRRANFANQKIELFKPAIDVRYAEEEVVSHDSTSMISTPVHNSAEILIYVNLDTVEVVGIDEVQFFDEGIVDVCNKLADNGIRVIVAGLDMDYTGKPFASMPQLMAVAEYVTKTHAICVKCGDLAQYSHRLVANKKQVLLGEKDSYEPLCRHCYNEVRRMEEDENSKDFEEKEEILE